ncbi:restriction endonuclease subunit S [Agathobacter rectalis]|jgi:type I restriction enzyme S subunit|uniref:Type I restriction modification DNA specificity domain n=1 Tax=Agathobacter rectalis TaxID=39491 RepID=A0A173T2H8_9FIRM|nr:restriction endonuclease subunit S [Agathobacter rectalis]CUM96982.1 Type I restriction modification DNA specificity domain [Agathobacter rectalis]
MKEGYRVLGEYIRQVDIRNKEGKKENLLGVSVQKQFIQSIANTVGTDFTKYKVVKKGQFTYIPDTSRRGDKIAIALLEDYEEGLVSNVYTVFEVIDTEKLLPEYLMLWFSRPEFDRYARFKSHGSVREVMDWEEMCKVELPVPDIEKQRKIVKAYKTITDRIALKQKINDNLVSTLQIIYKKMFLESQNTYITKPLADLCSKIGSGATPKGGKAAYFDKGISLIRSMNVFDYFFSYPELAHISQIQANALANVEIQQADVLFNITGVSVTRCCVVPDDVLPARVNQHVMIIRPYKGKNMSYYIMCTLCTSENKAKLLGIGQSGSTREAINKQELERFEIPVPSDEELERFGEIATKIYALIFSNTNEIRMLCDMKDTLLTKLSSY